MIFSVSSPNVMLFVRICEDGGGGWADCEGGKMPPGPPRELREGGGSWCPPPLDEDDDEATVLRSLSRSMLMTFGEDDLPLFSAACSDDIVAFVGCRGGPISRELYYRENVFKLVGTKTNLRVKNKSYKACSRQISVDTHGRGFCARLTDLMLDYGIN